MSEKVVQLGVTRDARYMYFVRGAQVCRVLRRGLGSLETDSEVVQQLAFERSPRDIYFLDGDGDLARSPLMGNLEPRPVYLDDEILGVLLPSLTVMDLKATARSLGVPAMGSKDELVKQLVEPLLGRELGALVLTENRVLDRNDWNGVIQRLGGDSRKGLQDVFDGLADLLVAVAVAPRPHGISTVDEPRHPAEPGESTGSTISIDVLRDSLNFDPVGGIWTLSLRQPWAWAVMHAGKSVAVRPTATAVRGTVALFASGGEIAPGDLERLRAEGLAVPDTFETDCVIGAVDIVSVRESVDNISEHAGGYAWELARPRPLASAFHARPRGPSLFRLPLPEDAT